MSTITRRGAGHGAPIRACRPGVAAALAAAAIASPALAEDAMVSRPIEAAVLHEGTLDMVAYYLPAGDGKLEVTATFLPKLGSLGGRPMRTVMVLADGEEVAFAMPGHPEALYRFARHGTALNASVRPVDPLGARRRASVAAAE